MTPRPPAAVFTTSWDDGHPADLRIAERLARRGLPGTFYIPAHGPCDGMSPAAVRDLASAFDIGAHTLHHRRLNELSFETAGYEIRASKRYIEDLLGRGCTVFAPPGGRYRRAHLLLAAQAGFRGFRTTELMSLAPPDRRGEIAILPTTIQLVAHAWPVYWRNALSRGRTANLANYLRAGGGPPERAFSRLLDRVLAEGGVLHLWGHGWEIEETAAWPLLDAMLDRVAERRAELCLTTNTGLSEGAWADGHLTLAATNPVLPG